MDITKLLEQHIANTFIGDATAFMKGELDCINEVPHKEGKGTDYDRGYAARYELDQILGEMK
jgi:hypothetical protein